MTTNTNNLKEGHEGIGKLSFPVKSKALRRSLIRHNQCPECGTELDTGYECNNRDCQYDALPELKKRL